MSAAFIKIYQLYFDVLSSGDLKNATYGIGDGPLRAVMRAVVEAIGRNNTVWRVGTRYNKIHFNGLPSLDRQRTLWAHGILAAIHIQTLLLGPDPISPWILYAAMCDGPSAWDDLDFSLIERLDPDAAKTLSHWWPITKDTTFSASDTKSKLSFILNHYCDFEVSISIIVRPINLTCTTDA